MRTYAQKPQAVERQWYLIDAAGMTLGRLATLIATRLTGKHKPSYTPHVDGGDTIVVVNAAEVAVTGDKARQKRYFRHTGYPGGIRSKTLEQQLNDDPTKVIERAVAGMVPDNKLKADRLKRLKVYPDSEHPHGPQKPISLGDDHGK